VRKLLMLAVIATACGCDFESGGDGSPVKAPEKWRTSIWLGIQKTVYNLPDDVRAEVREVTPEEIKKIGSSHRTRGVTVDTRPIVVYLPSDAQPYEVEHEGAHIALFANGITGHPQQYRNTFRGWRD